MGDDVLSFLGATCIVPLVCDPLMKLGVFSDIAVPWFSIVGKLAQTVFQVDPAVHSET
jgi:hypothetical protein